jgi:methyl-accepting chemotaxis protein
MAGVSSYNLVQAAHMQGRVEVLSDRDLMPLANVRKINRSYQSYIVHSLVLALPGNDEATIKQHLQLKEQTKNEVNAELVAMLATTPAELQPQARAIKEHWTAFLAAHAAAQAALAARRPTRAS